MYTKVQTIAQTIEKIAPKCLAESWDNVGLIIGDMAQKVKKVMISLDIDLEVLREATDKNVDLIITHHPPIFNSLKKITLESINGKIIYNLIKNNISVYTAHTNLDIANGGVNDILAQELGLRDVKLLEVNKKQKRKKLAVFVPIGHENNVMEAISSAGGGWMGNYSHCFFKTMGNGTFLPHDGSEPYIGKINKIQNVKEIRVETIISESNLKNVINKMTKVHPYEEVAFDVYDLENQNEEFSIGRIGYVNNKSIKELIHQIKKTFNLSTIKYAGSLKEEVEKVAIVAGSGGSFIKEAVYKGAQVLVTGDVSYHQAQEAKSLNISVIDIGHFESERIILPALAEILRKSLLSQKSNTEVLISEKNKEVFNYY